MAEQWVFRVWAINAQGAWQWFMMSYPTLEECERVSLECLRRVYEAGESGRGVIVTACSLDLTRLGGLAEATT